MKQKHVIDNLPKIEGARIAIVQSKWYREYTDVMVEKCMGVLSHTSCKTPEVHILPGSLELPLAAQSLCQKYDDIEAIIAFGIIMKGETMHFDMIVDECMRGLGEVMRKYSVPVLVEVLPITDIEQAKARCGDDEFNKGIEAAIAATEFVAWKRELKEKKEKGFGFSAG